MSDAPLRAAIDRAIAHGAIAALPWSAVRVEGRDSADLLGRLSTNDLRPLEGGRSVATLFLTPMGRLAFRVVLQPTGDALRACVEAAGEHGFAEWVDRYTFAEDVRVTLEPDVAVAMAIGPGHGPGVGEVVSGSRESLAPTLHPDAWTQLRVLAREPAGGHELTEEYHPLEAALEAHVSFTKGCYTGQEVVARQDSRGKVARRLVVLASDEPLAEGDTFAGDMKAGCRVTTIAPERDASLGWLALAYVAARSSEPGSEVVTASGSRARVIAPPLGLAAPPLDLAPPPGDLAAPPLD